MAVRRKALEQVGGWEALADYLADDNRLGVALASAGNRVGLSHHIATLRTDRLTWREYWRHQRRIAITYRACNPLGFAGSLCVQGVPFALLAFCLRPGSLLFQSIVLITLFVRLSTVRALTRILSFPLRSRFSLVEVLLSSHVEIACWLLAWLSPRVRWAGRDFHVTAGGELEWLYDHSEERKEPSLPQFTPGCASSTWLEAADGSESKSAREPAIK